MTDEHLMRMVRIYHGCKTDDELVEQVGYGLELCIAKMREACAAAPEVEAQERELIARNAINCALEEAAEVCMRHIEDAKEWGHFDEMRTAATLADMIRALKSEPPMNSGGNK